MSLQSVNCTTTTFNFAAGYMVDVVDYPLEEELEVYLHHWHYDGIKVHIFDIRKDELGYGGCGCLKEYIEGHLVHGHYIQDFERKYFI